MGCNVAEVACMSRSSSSGKVHVSMCKELAKIINRTLNLVPAIEEARPGFRLGITELVSLNGSIEKAKLLIERCEESSKLYLAITGETFVTRCERIKSSIEKSLTHIHNMVPEPIATQISDAIDSFRDVKFAVDSSDEEAHKALVSLLSQDVTTEDSELKGFQFAASKLYLTSPRALLVEKRHVQKLLGKCDTADFKKERILKYLLHLIRKHGNKIQVTSDDFKETECVARNESSFQKDSSCDTNFSERTCRPAERIPEKVSGKIQNEWDMPGTVPTPEKFKCPISSRIMYDPVIIASGQTYERKYIEMWFNEGHDTCPVTQMKLSNLFMIPNSSMKVLISEWCGEHGIILQDMCSQPMHAQYRSWNSSTSSSLNSVYALVVNNRNADYSFKSDYSNASITTNSITEETAETNAHSQMFVWSDDYQKTQSFSGFSRESYMRFLSKLSELPFETCRKAMEDLEITFSKDDGTCSLMLSNGFLASLVRFLKDAYHSSSLAGQKSGLEILLVFLSYMREEIPSLNDDASLLLTCLMYPEKLSLEELKVIRALCFYYDCRPVIVASGVSNSIIKVLDSDDPKFLEVAVDIIFQLSSLREMSSVILSPGYLQSMVPLLVENQFAGRCSRILQNVCDTEEGKRAIATADGLVASLVELLEHGRKEDQTVAVSMLLSLCSCSSENCDIVMKEGIIPPLVDISINGTRQSIEDSKLLLQLLRDHSRSNDSVQNSADARGSSSGSQPDPPIDVSATEIPRRKDDLPSDSNPSGRPGLVSPSRTKKQSMKSSTNSGVTGFFKRSFFIFLKPKSSSR